VTLARPAAVHLEGGGQRQGTSLERNPIMCQTKNVDVNGNRRFDAERFLRECEKGMREERKIGR
jgi:hypothetical protein